MGFDVVLDIGAKGGTCTIRDSNKDLPKRYQQTGLLTVPRERSVTVSAANKNYAEAPSIKVSHRLHKIEQQRAHDHLMKICFGHPTKPRSARRRVLSEIPRGDPAKPLALIKPEGQDDEEWAQPLMYEDFSLQKPCKIVGLVEALKEARQNCIAQSESSKTDYLVFSTPIALFTFVWLRGFPMYCKRA